MAVLNKNWESANRVSPKEAAVVTGEDADEALAAVVRVIESGFGE